MRLVACFFSVIVLFSACSTNNVDEKPELGAFFEEEGVEGCFGLFDNGQGRFQLYNIARYKDSAYTPASTFKIVNSLIALETGVAPNDSLLIPWDGVTRSIPTWNQDLTMQQAFEYSAVPWYREIARRIGTERMQFWLDTLGYASRYQKPVITDNLDTFWLDNSVRVTADENLGLVKQLYFAQLPFQPRTQRIVKNLMLREKNEKYLLAYKTGWGITPDGHQLGWITGWIEENVHPYFFVLQIESADPNFPMVEKRERLLRKILGEMGFFEGEK